MAVEFLESPVERTWIRSSGSRNLRTIIGLGCASLSGALGWWLGGQWNLGAAVILGGIASGVGLYYGNKWFDNNLR